VRFLWALIGLLYALMSIYVGYQFVTLAMGPRLSEKGLPLQAAPFLGGIALALVALPLIWNSIRLATARIPRY
jgi:hypothetical protein